MKYHKDVKRWRVFWHVTLPDGTVDKGSKSFKEKDIAKQLKLTNCATSVDGKHIEGSRMKFLDINA